jgi:putative two-component system hydrogenase maturation factor HypX/HoxX
MTPTTRAQCPSRLRRPPARQNRRTRDEAIKPLSAYRDAELAHLRKNFFDFDTHYYIAHYDFITCTSHSRTPLHLAQHRQVR